MVFEPYIQGCKVTVRSISGFETKSDRNPIGAKKTSLLTGAVSISKIKSDLIDICFAFESLEDLFLLDVTCRTFHAVRL